MQNIDVKKHMKHITEVPAGKLRDVAVMWLPFDSSNAEDYHILISH